VRPGPGVRCARWSRGPSHAEPADQPRLRRGDPDVGGTAEVYQNGRLVDSAENPGLNTNPTQLYLGTALGAYGAGSFYSDGMIDDLAVWNRVLDADEADRDFSSFPELTCEKPLV